MPTSKSIISLRRYVLKSYVGYVSQLDKIKGKYRRQLTDNPYQAKKYSLLEAEKIAKGTHFIVVELPNHAS